MEREFQGIFQRLIEGDPIIEEGMGKINDIFEQHFPDGQIDLDELSNEALDKITEIGVNYNLIPPSEEVETEQSRRDLSEIFLVQNDNY